MNLTKPPLENNVSIDINSVEGELTLQSSQSPFTLSLRIANVNSEKEFDSFIKNCERLVRSSLEYKEWISYIIEVLGERECSLTHELISECNIEIHHHPINLYTICGSIVVDQINKGQKFCTFDIATLVIELHFNNKVGFIPLLSDLHHKYHSGFLDLPIELVKGDYKYLLESLPIDDNERPRIYSLCNIHLDDCKVGWIKDKYPGIEEPLKI